VAIAGIIGTMIGVLAIVIPLIISAGARTSSAETVQVEQQGDGQPAGLEPASVVAPLQPGLQSQALGATVDESYLWSGSYAVPVDAPWAELWSYQSDECYTSEQIAWLERYGVEIPTPFLSVGITNTATSGSPITFRNIRLQGTVTPPTGDTVTVTYPTCIGDGVFGIFAHMTVGVDPVALYDECYAPDALGLPSCYVGEGDTTPLPGDPLVFAIPPGAYHSLNLNYDQVADFTGRFVADVEVDGQVSTIDLSPPGSDIVSPMVTRSALLSIGAVDLTDCRADDESAYIDDCSLETWLEILASR
jgi:hypothetical protein